MFLPPRNKVFVDDNTLHVQSGVTISTDDDGNVNGRSSLIVCWLLMYNSI